MFVTSASFDRRAPGWPAQEWPDDGVLVLHGWDLEPGAVESIRLPAESGRMKLSLKLVPYDLMGTLYASADIGLALDRGVDDDYFHMASRKIAHCVRCGAPVIAADFPVLRSILEDNECGICLSTLSQVQEAAGTILRNRSLFSERARQTYHNQLEFGRHFQQVIDRVAALAEANSGQASHR